VSISRRKASLIIVNDPKRYEPPISFTCVVCKYLFAECGRVDVKRKTAIQTEQGYLTPRTKKKNMQFLTIQMIPHMSLA